MDRHFDESILRKAFNERYTKYEQLAINLQQSLKILVAGAEIDILDVHWRIKDFESFSEKVIRKKYSDPFKENEDFCGLRIICNYPTDLEQISTIIRREFNVIDSIDKGELLSTDQFGYRSIHLIVTLKDEWLNVPNLRNLAGLKAEIQIRTILMHAWASVQHKLAYKKKEHIPNQFQRKMNQLSALFEIADQQFDSLRKEREEYREKLKLDKEHFDIEQPLNLDSLQAFLDFYFPDRSRNESDTQYLLDELIQLELSLKTLYEAVKMSESLIEAVETDFIHIFYENRVVEKFWVQTGVIRIILSIANDFYWLNRYKNMDNKHKKVLNKWRIIYSEKKVELGDI